MTSGETWKRCENVLNAHAAGCWLFTHTARSLSSNIVYNVIHSFALSVSLCCFLDLCSAHAADGDGDGDDDDGDGVWWCVMVKRWYGWCETHTARAMNVPKALFVCVAVCAVWSGVCCGLRRSYAYAYAVSKGIKNENMIEQFVCSDNKISM